MRPDVQNKQVEGEEPTEKQQVENSYREYTKEIERRKHRQCSKHTYGEGPTKQQVENSYGKTIEEMERLERQQLSRYHRYIGRKRRLKFTYEEEPIKQQVENSYGKTTKEEEQERAYGNPQFLKMYNSLDEKQKRPDVQNKQVEGEEPTEQQVENGYRKRTEEEEQEEQERAYDNPPFLKMYNSLNHKAQSHIKFHLFKYSESAKRRNAAMQDIIVKRMLETRKKCEEGKRMRASRERERGAGSY